MSQQLHRLLLVGLFSLVDNVIYFSAVSATEASFSASVMIIIIFCVLCLRN